MNTQDSSNYLLLEIFALRERAERSRERAHHLLSLLHDNASHLSYTRERFQLISPTTPSAPCRIEPTDYWTDRTSR